VRLLVQAVVALERNNNLVAALQATDISRYIKIINPKIQPALWQRKCQKKKTTISFMGRRIAHENTWSGPRSKFWGGGEVAWRLG